MFVTTFAPTTFPNLVNNCLRSVALVCCDKPETHRLRPCDDEFDFDTDVFVAFSKHYHKNPNKILIRTECKHFFRNIELLFYRKLKIVLIIKQNDKQ